MRPGSRLILCVFCGEFKDGFELHFSLAVHQNMLKSQSNLREIAVKVSSCSLHVQLENGRKTKFQYTVNQI